MRRRLTTDEFIKQAKKIHGDKYDYSMTEYIDAHTKVCIICPIHGEFWQTPTCHTDGKTGCPKCSITHKTKETYKQDLIQYVNDNCSFEIENEDFEYIKAVGKYKNGGYYTFSSKELEMWLNYSFGNKYLYL